MQLAATYFAENNALPPPPFSSSTPSRFTQPTHLPLASRDTARQMNGKQK